MDAVPSLFFRLRDSSRAGECNASAELMWGLAGNNGNDVAYAYASALVDATDFVSRECCACSCQQQRTQQPGFGNMRTPPSDQTQHTVANLDEFSLKVSIAVPA